MKLISVRLPLVLRDRCRETPLKRLLPAVAFLGNVGCGGNGSPTGGTASPVSSAGAGSSSSSSSSSSGASTSSSSSSSSGASASSSSSSSSGGSGSSSSTSSGAGVNQAMGGIWNAASLPAIGPMLVTGDGRFFYYSSSVGLSYILDTVNIGSLNAAGYILSGAQESGSFYGHGEGFGINIVNGSSVSVGGVISQMATVAFAGNTWTYDTSGLYDRPSSLAAVAGIWNLNLSTSQGANPAIIDANGVLFQSDPNPSNDCTISGQISLIDPAHNAYSIALAYSGINCYPPILGATGAGLAYLDYTTTPVTLRYAIGVQNSTGNAGIISGAGQPYQSLGGVWTATSQTGGTASMLSDYVGNFFYQTVAGSCTELYQGELTQSYGLPTVSGNGVFSTVQSSCNGGPQAESYSGTLSPGTSLTLTSAGTNSGIGLPFSWAYNGSAYDQPSSLAAVTGNWITPNGYIIAIDSGGHLSGSLSSSGCTVSGRISIDDPAANVYHLAMAYSGCTSVPADLSNFVTDATGLDGATVTGLATIDTSMSPNQLDMWSLFQFTDGSADAIAYVVGTSN
jgi:hypothetical protein